MKATSREQNGQSKGDIHSTTISGWGLGCTLGNVDINWLTNLRLCCCNGFAFFGGGGGGGSLAAILRLRLRGGLSSFGGGGEGGVGGGGLNKVQGSVRGITHRGTPQTSVSDDSGWYIYGAAGRAPYPRDLNVQPCNCDSASSGFRELSGRSPKQELQE